MSQFAAMRAAVACASSARRLGMGFTLFTQASGTTSTVSNLVNVSGMTGEAQAALQTQLENLAPGTLDAMNSAVDTVNSLGPMTDIAGAIAGGNAPSPAMVVGALSVAATMSMGPIAGAAVFAAGEAVSAIFDALQGPSPPPPPEWNYKGFLRLAQIQGAADGGYDPVPYGPADPKWIHCAGAADVIAAVVHGTGMPSNQPVDAPSGGFSFGTAALWAVCLEISNSWSWVATAISQAKASKAALAINPMSMGLQTQEDAEAFYAATTPNNPTYGTTNGRTGNDVLNGYNSPNGNDFRQEYLGFDALYGLQQDIWEGMTCKGGYDPWFAAPDITNAAEILDLYNRPPLKLVVDPHFSVLYAAVLAQDIEQWANGHSYIDPYQLLLSCAAAWNATHSNSSTVTFSPYDYYASDYQLTYNGAHNGIVQSFYDIQQGETRSVMLPVYFWRNPIYTILRGWQFDITNSLQVSYQWHPPFTINTGPSTGAIVKGPTGVGNLSLGAKIALGIAAVPVAAVAGGTGYALVTRQSVKRVLGGMWKSTKKPFVSAGHAVGEGAKRLGRGAKHLVKRNPLPATEVQTLLLPRGRFSQYEAVRWAERHGYSARKVHATDRYFRIRQHPPSEYKRGSFRTIELGSGGIKAVVGRPR